MTASSQPATTDPLVLVAREGHLTRITLNRPRALNALNYEMLDAVSAAVKVANSDGSQAILLEGAGDRGFSGGGDIKVLGGGDLEAGIELLRLEYRTDFEVSDSAIPVVSFMDGVTMGGGIGLTGHSDVRVVTERSMLAMPETRIGISPDIGGHLLLSRAPGRMGEYLAITAAHMSAGDAIALGFADFYVDSSRLGEITEALRQGVAPAEAVMAASSPAPVAELARVREWFDELAEDVLSDAAAVFADPVTAAIALLERLESSPRQEAQDVARTVRRMNPASIAVTLAQHARTRAEQLTLQDVLRDDLRVLGRLIGLPNFAEGVRAQLIERDGNPQWQPARVEDLDREVIAAILHPEPAPGEVPLQFGER